jgi:hypothetical protein
MMLWVVLLLLREAGARAEAMFEVVWEGGEQGEFLTAAFMLPRGPSVVCEDAILCACGALYCR